MIGRTMSQVDTSLVLACSTQFNFTRVGCVNAFLWIAYRMVSIFYMSFQVLEQNQNGRWKGKVKNGDVSCFVSCCQIYFLFGWNSTLLQIQCSLLALFSKQLFPYQMIFKFMWSCYCYVSSRCLGDIFQHVAWPMSKM